MIKGTLHAAARKLQWGLSGNDHVDRGGMTRRLHRLQVFYVLEKPPAGWTGGTGYVSKAMVHEHLPLPHEDVITLRCGPPPMNRAVEGILDTQGFTKEMQFEF